MRVRVTLALDVRADFHPDLLPARMEVSGAPAIMVVCAMQWAERKWRSKLAGETLAQSLAPTEEITHFRPNQIVLRDEPFVPLTR